MHQNILKPLLLSSPKMRKKDNGFNAKIALPLFVVFILVTSMFGYMWGSSKTRVDYGSFAFYQSEDGSYILKYGSARISFNNFPANLEWINATEGIGAVFSTPMFYVSSDPESSQAEAIAGISFSLGRLMGEVSNIYVQNSFISEGEHVLPVITCSNATIFTPVVLVENSNSTGPTEIVKQGSCIILSAKNRQEMYMAYERLVYIIMGVME